MTTLDDMKAEALATYQVGAIIRQDHRTGHVIRAPKFRRLSSTTYIVTAEALIDWTYKSTGETHRELTTLWNYDRITGNRYDGRVHTTPPTRRQRP